MSWARHEARVTLRTDSRADSPDRLSSGFPASAQGIVSAYDAAHLATRKSARISSRCNTPAVEDHAERHDAGRAGSASRETSHADSNAPTAFRARLQDRIAH